jgi:hypothetical protein
MSARYDTIDSVVTAMYESVCFEKGSQPDWSRDREIFAPGARMVRVNDDGVFEFDLDSYIANFMQMIADGTLPEFWEGEIWRSEQVMDSVAHVLSGYETRPRRGGNLLNRGVNSIQMFRRDGRWWISAMIWRRDGKRFQTPLQAM